MVVDKERDIVSYTKDDYKNLQKVLMPLMIWFQCLGLQSMDLSSQKFWRVLSKLPKYPIALLILFMIFNESVTLVTSSDKKVHLTSVISFIFTCSVFVSLYRDRRRLPALFSRIYRVSNQLRTQAFLKRSKRLVYLQWFMFSLVLLLESVSHFMMMDETGVVTQQNDEGPHNSFLSYSAFSSVMEGVYTRMSYLFLFNFCVYYCTLCEILTNCFQCLKARMKSISLEMESKALIEIHRESTEILMLLDDLYSFSVFSIIFNLMTGLFWAGYIYAFTPHLSYNEISNCLTMAISNLLVLLRIILAATFASDAARQSQNAAMSLAGYIPSQHKDLKTLLFQNQHRYKRLTLWRMYDFDKSLFISIIGSLLTYGIIIGTLGNVSNNPNEEP